VVLGLGGSQVAMELQMEKTDETTFSCVLTREGSFGFASGDL